MKRIEKRAPQGESHVPHRQIEVRRYQDRKGPQAPKFHTSRLNAQAEKTQL